jgi:hypothetical protein
VIALPTTNTVVASIAIRQQNLPVIFQEALWSIAAAIHREVEDVVWLSLVANVNPHARIRNFIFALHGHDGVIGMRVSYGR